MSQHDLLRRDIRRLGDLLGDVIREQAGEPTFELIERIRHLSRDRRAATPGSEAELAHLITGLQPEQIRYATRAFTIFFDLSNLAEDRHRGRVLRDRAREKYPAPIGESIAAAGLAFRDAGMTPAQVQTALDQLEIELVFTAHPSEAKRRAIRTKLRRMRLELSNLDKPDVLPNEEARLLAQLKGNLATLWETETLKPERPTVMDEVERGLSIVPRLWEVVPTIYESLRQSLAAAYPEHTFSLPAFLKFGSWIGGDRDGHPGVTAEVTEQTVRWLRREAIARHLESCRQAYLYVTVASTPEQVPGEIATKLATAEAQWPECQPHLAAAAPKEWHRRWIRLIEWRLLQSQREEAHSPLPLGAYRDGDELGRDIERLWEWTRERCGNDGAGEVGRWVDQNRVFGLHLTRLDIRQDSARYREILQEILAQLTGVTNYAELSEAERQELLSRTFGDARPLDEERLSPLARDTLKLYRFVLAAVERFGPQVFGANIVSMTRCPSDVLSVLWFWRRAEAERDMVNRLPGPRIAPLFEKIGDLRDSPQTLAGILDNAMYTAHLERMGRRQIVMVGYSDSTKDGGYLAASWGLYRSQDELQRVADERGVHVTFFHGRGGSLGRGGGPAARGILSLPPRALGGSLRLTEQGEVLAERYDDVQIAARHLEQVTWATLVASNLPRPDVPQEWLDLMQALSERSFKAYRELVDQPGFIAYFEAATPIEEIENLPITSRPSRRTGQRTLSDLRAVPWVFSWTQNRCLIPAWYGMGTALSECKYRDRHSWQLVCDMYRQWPFFQATVDNAALALAKADMYIGQRYSELCPAPDVRERIWMLIASEMDRSRQAVLDIVGGMKLLAGTPWFQGSVEVRNPYIDPLNLMQIELLKRRRALEPEAPEEERQACRALLRLTLQGVAAGMRTTG